MLVGKGATRPVCLSKHRTLELCASALARAPRGANKARLDEAPLRTPAAASLADHSPPLRVGRSPHAQGHGRASVITKPARGQHMPPRLQTVA